MELNSKLIEPIGKRLLIKVFEGVRETEGGIILSESAGAATPVLGTVLKSGKGSDYKKGDHVFFRRYSIDEIKVDAATDQKIYMLEESEVIGVYKGQVE